jgi:hypothetical protein
LDRIPQFVRGVILTDIHPGRADAAGTLSQPNGTLLNAEYLVGLYENRAIDIGVGVDFQEVWASLTSTIETAAAWVNTLPDCARDRLFLLIVLACG